MAIDPEELEPKKKSQDLTLIDLSSWSIEELEERIVDLKAEITRCQNIIKSKQSSMAAADAVFKK